MPSTRRQPEDIRFCLDENLSYRVAEALSIVGAPFIHISKVPGLEGKQQGRSGADDETVARWCEAKNRVLVTCDSDFRGRWVRSSLLAQVGVELIVFNWQVRGLQEQHRQITRRYNSWINQLSAHPQGHRVWLQRKGRTALVELPR